MTKRAPKAKPPERAPMDIRAAPPTTAADANPFVMVEPPPGVLPRNKTGHGLANDYGVSGLYEYGAAGITATLGGDFGVARWMGYPALAQLSQRPEYRNIVETIAGDMTREWIEWRATGDDDKSERIGQLEDAMRRLNVKDVFTKLVEMDGYFGRAQLLPLLGADDDELGKPLTVTPAKIGKGSLKGLRTIEPMWTYPTDYDAKDPLSPDFYRPRNWYVMGRKISATRLITIVSSPVPDILKPAYQFGGLSKTQMAKETVERCIRTFRSVSDLIRRFSQSVLKTNMSSALNAGSGDVEMARAQLFAQVSENRDLMMLDFETEEYLNVAAPLGTLDALQAQAQEHVCSISRIPLVKYTGITPSGLNASSDGEIRVYYDSIHEAQEDILRSPLKWLTDIVQLSEFGDIDDEITFNFKPLWQTSEAERATIAKTNADTDAVYVTTGALGPEDVRAKLAGDEGSRYHGLEGEAPGPPEDGGEGEEPDDTGDPAEALTREDE